MRKSLVILALLTALPLMGKAENLCDLARELGPSHIMSNTTPDNRAPLWELQWHDEFEVPGKLNPNLWKFEIGTGTNGWGNKEAQYYTDRLENARVENGRLIIEARKEDFGNKHYTSARINAVQKMTYGRIEIKAKLAHGRGLWGAAWMLAAKQVHGPWFWPDNGEFDLIENIGNEANINHISVHSNSHNFMHMNPKTYIDPVYEGDQNFHVYAAEWLPESITFYRDGVLKFRVEKKEGNDWREWPFDQDMYLIMNLAVGGTWGIQDGPLDESAFPTHMEFDYVRAYRPSAENPGCQHHLSIIPDAPLPQSK